MRKCGTAILLTLAISILIIQAKAPSSRVEYQKYNLEYPRELIELAASIDMEPIDGKVFLHNLRIYSGQGLPYVFDVLSKPEKGQRVIPSSVLFWCQKGEKKYLVYAVDNQEMEEDYNYKVKSILGGMELYGHNYDIETSYGLSVYDNILGTDKDLSHFTYLDNKHERGPEGILPTRSNGFLPIIMYGAASTTVLYYYNDRWLEYVERDI